MEEVESRTWVAPRPLRSFTCSSLRTMFTSGKTAYVQAGAGIVADSNPTREYEECVNKSAALVRAVDLARAGE